MECDDTVQLRELEQRLHGLLLLVHGLHGHLEDVIELGKLRGCPHGFFEELFLLYATSAIDGATIYIPGVLACTLLQKGILLR